MTPKFLKHTPLPLRWLAHPMLLLSIVLHGLLIFIPDLADHNSDTDTDELAAPSIQITRLPELTHPAPEPSTTASRPPDEASISSATPRTRPPSSTIPATTPSPTPTPTPASNENLSSEPSSPPNSLPPPVDTPLPFANFPQLANAQAGCFGLENCHQVDGGNFRQVGTNLVEQLRGQGYRVEPRDDLEETGVKVYEVTQDETTQYLTVLSPELGVAIYVLAAEPVSVAELQAAESLSMQFQNVLNQVANGQHAALTQVPYPQSFGNGTTPRPEIRTPIYWAKDAPPDRLAVPLTNQLVNAGFAVEPVGEHGGAPLYQVSRGAFAAYLSIVPESDQSGSILVAWDRLPS